MNNFMTPLEVQLGLGLALLIGLAIGWVARGRGERYERQREDRKIEKAGVWRCEARGYYLSLVKERGVRERSAACHQRSHQLRKVLDSYATANFNLVADFQHLYKTNLRAALRQARRTFFLEAFLCRNMEEFSTYKQVMLDAGWMYRGEAREDYDQIVHELFDGDYFRPSALAERKRRSNA